MRGETLRLVLSRAREALDQAVYSAGLSYQFGANAYAYETLMTCTNARDAVARLTSSVTDLSHYVDAVQSHRDLHEPEAETRET
jgi:hypothetical protein